MQRIEVFSNRTIHILREDLLHPHISGNKWRKLKYNVIAADERGYDTILTFGGAFSNHIAATAAAGKEFGFKTIGMIRGEDDSQNPTLKFARGCGMQLEFVSRSNYRDRGSKSMTTVLRSRFGSFYEIPEGGSDHRGIAGCVEIADQWEEPFDYVVLACGTGATLAGITAGNRGKIRQKVIGIPILKTGDGLRGDIQKQFFKLFLDSDIAAEYDQNYETIDDYHFGGYARFNDELIDFVKLCRRNYDLSLDLVYTGKAFYGLLDLIEKGYFKPEDRILFIHTGGLQGNAGMKYLHGIDL